MGDLFSISILQILSVLSFVTSILAVLRVGSVSLHRLSHKFEADVARPAPEMAVGNPAKWNWSLSGLPVSFSIGTLIGEDEGEEHENGMGGYTGGTDLVRMDWQISRPRTVQMHPQYSQPPISMAKLIMSRHVQRKSARVPRRVPGIARPTTPSRLVHSVA